MFIVFGRDISLVLWTSEISLLKNNSHDLHRVITHSLVLVILYWMTYTVLSTGCERKLACTSRLARSYSTLWFVLHANRLSLDMVSLYSGCFILFVFCYFCCYFFYLVCRYTRTYECIIPDWLYFSSTILIYNNYSSSTMIIFVLWFSPTLWFSQYIECSFTCC